MLVSLQRYATISAQRNKNRVAHADYKLRLASSSAALAQKVVEICEKFVKNLGFVTEDRTANCVPLHACVSRAVQRGLLPPHSNLLSEFYILLFLCLIPTSISSYFISAINFISKTIPTFIL